MMIELVMAMTVLGGVVLLLAAVLSEGVTVVAASAEQHAAADRLSRALAEVRHGVIAVRDGASVEIQLSREQTGLRHCACTITIEPWAADDALRRVSATVTWRADRARLRSLSAVTLVRVAKLRLVEGRP